MRRPNLKTLAMFDAAGRQGSFRRAGEEMNLSQGAVAQQVRQLEASLGVELFHRHPRGLTLTTEGHAYHVAVSNALAGIDRATGVLLKSSPAIVLSVTPSFASKWLVPRLAEFAKIHPEINLQTHASEARANFKNDGVTLSIRQGLADSKTNAIQTLLAPQELCAVCRPGFTGCAFEKVSDFADHPLIQDGHNHWQDLFENAGLPRPPRILQFNQTALAMDAAANGQGIALAPRIFLNADLSDRRLEILWQNSDADPVGFYLIHPATPDPARDKVSAWLQSRLNPTPDAQFSNPDN